MEETIQHRKCYTIEHTRSRTQIVKYIRLYVNKSFSYDTKNTQKCSNYKYNDSNPMFSLENTPDSETIDSYVEIIDST